MELFHKHEALQSKSSAYRGKHHGFTQQSFADAESSVVLQKIVYEVFSLHKPMEKPKVGGFR